MSFKRIAMLAVLQLFFLIVQGQKFSRSELSTYLVTPWEIIYGPDDHLWVTEAYGTVSRIDPNDGSKNIVFKASDYFHGAPQEALKLCDKPAIGNGTLGMALHPNFSVDSTAYIYYYYSYNYGSSSVPETRFKIRRLKWDATTEKIIDSTDLVTGIISGYGHIGGRLIIVEQNNKPYLFLSVGDYGISETNSPDCYVPQSTNPNNYTQDVNTQNGKIHRFNLDGSIPVDNPISGNSYYTRGHRNPQGLMYNTDLGIIYDVEHGDRTDDEINILYKGMNYGWKQVRGYHSDNNHAGESSYIASYTANPNVPNDSLVEAFYSWCAVSPDTSSNYFEWCTVAPSDGLYYNSQGISEWTNSLLVVTLKNGTSTDSELYQFKLDNTGKLVPSTVENPNPKKFFGEDQALNGRLRDIAVSTDGKKLYLINNWGAPSEKITVYSVNPTGIGTVEEHIGLQLFPNPSNGDLTIEFDKINKGTLEFYNSLGEIVYSESIGNQSNISITLPPALTNGIYILRLVTENSMELQKLVLKRE